MKHDRKQHVPQFGKPPEPERVPQPWQPRFGVGFMLLIMLAMTVVSAAGYYFMQAMQGDRGDKFVFILFTLISPVVAVVVISIGYQIYKFIMKS